MLDSQDKVDSFIKKEFNKELKNFTIVKDKNSYLLFDKFKIVRKRFGYEVSSLKITEKYLFNDVKNAVTYCIFENYNHYGKAMRVKDLDRIIADNSFEFELQQKLIKSKQLKEQSIVYFTKLSESQIKKRLAVEELAKLINISRNLLDKKFLSSLN